MIRIGFLLSFLVLSFYNSYSQRTYKDSLQAYINRYIKDHGVVKGNDKKYLDFFPIDENYRITAKIEMTNVTKWFQMETSGLIKKTFRTYGIISFSIHDTIVKLHVYQSQSLLQSEQYKNYLFIPFTDLTTGVTTYEAGRYIDIMDTEIKGDQVVIDFNKAYNPYCVYVKNIYNCPIPPRENDLPVAIMAGEKMYAKKKN